VGLGKFRATAYRRKSSSVIGNDSLQVQQRTIAQGQVFSRLQNNGIMELRDVLNVKPLILNDERPREKTMIPKSFRLLFPLLIIVMLAASGTEWSRVSAGGEEWRPVDPADLALKAAVVEPNADAEAIFWDIRIDDGGENDLVLNHYVRIKI